MAKKTLNFIHISDIHFHKQSGGPLDLDLELRSQLENDVKTVKDKIGDVFGILVTGDIAYSGLKEEYGKALEWLDKLCKLIECPEENVWSVPGNHDVVRDTIDNSKPLRVQYDRFREVPLSGLNTEIKNTINDDTYSKILFDSISSYIDDFASKHECDINPENNYWECDIKDELDGNIILRLHGATSTLVSDKNDDEEHNKLILGSHQAMLLQDENVIYLTLCHHPPEWLRDRDDIKARLDVGAKIQLFGHKHIQTVEHMKNTKGVDTLRIGAGAVQPERDIEWEPRYNFISLFVNEAEGVYSLCVTVYPRVWNDASREFGPELTQDGKEDHTYSLSLPKLNRKGPSTRHDRQDIQKESIATSRGSTVTEKTATEFRTGELSMDPARKLTYKFLKLPYHVMMKIAIELELIEDEDAELKDYELYKKLFQRAKEKKLLADMWDAVGKHYGDEALNDNPFK